MVAFCIVHLDARRARTLAPHGGRRFARTYAYPTSWKTFSRGLMWIRLSNGFVAQSVLGRGLSEAVAAEGALKLMELRFLSCIIR